MSAVSGCGVSRDEVQLSGVRTVHQCKLLQPLHIFVFMPTERCHKLAKLWGLHDVSYLHDVPHLKRRGQVLLPRSRVCPERPYGRQYL